MLSLITIITGIDHRLLNAHKMKLNLNYHTFFPQIIVTDCIYLLAKLFNSWQKCTARDSRKGLTKLSKCNFLISRVTSDCINSARIHWQMRVYFYFTGHPFFCNFFLETYVVKYAENDGEVRIWRSDLVLKL